MLNALGSLAEVADISDKINTIAKAIKQVAEFARKTKETTQAELDNIRNAYMEAVSLLREDSKKQSGELEAKLQKDFSSLKSEAKSAVEKMSKQVNESVKAQQDGMNFIHDKVSNLRSIKGEPGENGEDADEEKIKQEVVEYLTKEVIEPLKEELEETKKELEEQISKAGSRGGGGTTALNVAQTFKYIAHTEAPTGDIDGVNTTYTVNNTIFWVAGFTLNNQVIAELPNYTVAGRTITFSTALPASYSGKDFEIKYIGT